MPKQHFVDGKLLIEADPANPKDSAIVNLHQVKKGKIKLSDLTPEEMETIIKYLGGVPS